MTDKYAVIGNPIAHSKSPLIHRMFAEQTGQDISYEAILAPLDGFAATVERLRKEGYKGCNVTVPFKFEAFKLATELSERAQSAQAVNTLKFDGDAILGDNTDGAGLVRDIEHNFGISLQEKRMLLMGSGGAAYGVALPLWHSGGRLTAVSRDPEKARLLTEKTGMLDSYMLDETMLDSSIVTSTQYVLHTSYTGLTSHQFDIVINATSTGLTDEMPPLPHGIFAPGALAYDMMYGRETPFMKFAREHGAAVVADGLGMLVEQAAEAFCIWRGVRPDTAPVIAALRT
ncbi:MAG TPA: shikimate dehydrogenase [Gallionella sp.]|nr:shikimate dehydrogenase [Gallionella sp.]